MSHPEGMKENSALPSPGHLDIITRKYLVVWASLWLRLLSTCCSCWADCWGHVVALFLVHDSGDGNLPSLGLALRSNNNNQWSWGEEWYWRHEGKTAYPWIWISDMVGSLKTFENIGTTYPTASFLWYIHFENSIPRFWCSDPLPVLWCSGTAT